MLIRQDGSERPIDDSAAPIRDERGGVSGCVLIFRDVTAQRRSSTKTGSSCSRRALLASIVESSDDAIVSKSLDGIIQSWNAAAERLFGYPAEKAIGRHISLVIPPDASPRKTTIIASLKAGQRIEHFETERVRADGERVSVSLTISPIKDDAGNVVGASKIVRDITRERQAERRHAKTRRGPRPNRGPPQERVPRDARARAAQSARADHERARDLEALGGHASDSTARATTMERQLGQLVRLVDDLLDVSRITHDRLELRSSARRAARSMRARRRSVPAARRFAAGTS